ncbi:hypothetical protein BDV95DRAFT_599296 [Massariosphaeria phaeospora]|uniref:NADH:flavin oxidoreductase/NADH oxidase N-terminal domain-containing protein n=1 Tax=Massariosphaeria phaeospora TaxID=100035 RepID=A0A7C8M2D5_9PLEO|nr:hypothetical protein BDV95DRAFT_599296 [Massariosphaeria phaeospora]
MSDSKLFKTLKLGNIQLEHRIAMAPLTRFRASDDHTPILPMVADYYAQRASVPGTLLISEATFISPQAGTYPNAPGIYSQSQIDAWKTVTAAVHAKRSYIFLQLWHLGRASDERANAAEHITTVSSSAVRLEEPYRAVPTPLSTADIERTVADYATAAQNAMAAGFDGVEIHGANGYLIDQFTQDTVNQRSDAYGGSIAKRNRFALEVVHAVVGAVGAARTGIRLSPFSTFAGMRMADPVPQFSDLIRKISAAAPHMAYMHLVESRISGNADIESFDKLDAFVDLFPGPVLLAGGYKPASAKRVVDEEYAAKDVVVVFGRYFIANPDLAFRVREGIELAPYERGTFYNAKSTEGYVDYAFSAEFERAQGANL